MIWDRQLTKILSVLILCGFIFWNLVCAITFDLWITCYRNFPLDFEKLQLLDPSSDTITMGRKKTPHCWYSNKCKFRTKEYWKILPSEVQKSGRNRFRMCHSCLVLFPGDHKKPKDRMGKWVDISCYQWSVLASDILLRVWFSLECSFPCLI